MLSKKKKKKKEQDSKLFKEWKLTKITKGYGFSFSK